MESVIKPTENVEQRFGESLAARDASISIASDSAGIGPPDLCWVQKTSKKVFRSRNTLIGHYHWIIGLDVSTIASVAAYFANLSASAATEKVGILKGFVKSSTNILKRGIYCCYDPFSKLDIWIDFSVPGGSVARGIDKTGYLHDVNEEAWKGARIGCFLRWQLFDASITIANNDAFRILKSFSNHEEETDFLKTVVHMYKNGNIQIMLAKFQWDKGMGTNANDIDIVCSTILNYFKKRCRWQRALHFFTELHEFYPAAGTYLSYIYEYLGNKEGSREILKESLKLEKENLVLLLAHARTLLNKGEYENCLEVCQNVISLNDQLRPAWIIFVSCLLKMEEYAPALKALNVMPLPPTPMNINELLFFVVPSNPKSVNKSNGTYNPEVSEIRVMTREAKASSRLIPSLAGQILAPGEYGNSTSLPDCSPSRCTQSVMKSTYSILLSLVRDIGWEEFLHLRSLCFNIPDDDIATSLGSEDSYLQDVPLPNIIKIDFKINVDTTNNIIFEMNKSHVKQPVSVIFNFLYESEIRKQSFDEFLNTPQIMLTNNNSSNNIIFENNIIARTHNTPNLCTVEKEDISDINVSESPILDKIMDNVESFISNEDKCDDTTKEFHIKEDELEIYPEKIKNENECSISEVDEIPDAPDNILPKQCPPFNNIRGKGGPMSTTSLISHDSKFVKIVAMGIKERVKYFEMMAEKDEAAKRQAASNTSKNEAVKVVKPKSLRRHTKSIAEMLSSDLTFTDISKSKIESNKSKGCINECDIDRENIEEEKRQEMEAWDMFSLNGASSLPKRKDTLDNKIIKQNSCMEQFNENTKCVSFQCPPETDEETVIEYPNINISFLLQSLQEMPRCDCNEWLDELILALWEDLATYTELKDIDKKLKARISKTHAEYILGAVEMSFDDEDDMADEHNYEEDNTKRKLDEQEISESTPADWMRRGMLCERLQRIPEAEQAYRVCAFKTFNLTALLSLSHIYLSWGWFKETMVLLNRIAYFHNKIHKFSKNPYIPESIARILSELVGIVGNRELRLFSNTLHPIIQYVIDDVLKWQLRSEQEKKDIILQNPGILFLKESK